MLIRSLRPADGAEWRRMRRALWPETTESDHATDLEEYLGSPATHIILVAQGPPNELRGFAEVRLRSHAEDCFTSPVAYLEGWYVDLAARQRKIGAALVGAAERWAAARGCREFASDVPWDNSISLLAHRALGFEEGPTLVHFRKTLLPGTGADR